MAARFDSEALMSRTATSSIAPNVISDDLIRRFIREYNAENKVFNMDDMLIADITELRLSFQNIQKIQNLEGLHNLKKLCLDNNIIEVIEGLEEFLPNLEWLDLSFNSISMIEGLYGLPNLTDLSLFHNRIVTVADGLDDCPKLNVLSLGDNQIRDFEPMVSYLLKFHKLQVLNLAGNPITEHHEYPTKVIAYLTNLKYIDYSLIPQLEREKAVDTHRDELVDKRRMIEEEQKKEDDLEMDRIRIKELEDAFIDVTEAVMEHLNYDCEEDIAKINVLPEEQQNAYKDYEQAISEQNEAFQIIILKLNAQRMEEINRFNRSVRRAESIAEGESVELITEFGKTMKEVFKTTAEYDDEEKEEQEAAALKEGIEDLENQLLDIEIVLVERLNDYLTDKMKVLRDLVDKQIQTEVIQYQERLNNSSNEYFKKIQDIANEQLAKYKNENSTPDMFTAEQINVYKEETLNTAINSMKEEHNSKIDALETDISKAYRESVERFEEEFRRVQHLRNRNHIEEINTLVVKLRREVNERLSDDDYDD